MTTIIIHEDFIAADSQVSRGGVIDSNKFNKLVRLQDGILGCSGSVHDMRILQSFLKGHRENFPDELGCEGLFLPDKGQPFMISVSNGTLISEGVKQPYSIGSGSFYAIAAARAGASAKEAVKIACGIDVYSGGPIRVMKRGDKR